MAKLAWIANKYVDGKNDQRFYPKFLSLMQKEMEKFGHDLRFCFFSDLFDQASLTHDNFKWIPSDLMDDPTRVETEALRIEREYEFTFKQAFFPDLLQATLSQTGRRTSVPEDEFNQLAPLVDRFLYLERLVEREGVDGFFCDTSPEAEMELARAICHKKGKSFIRLVDCFFARNMFFKQTAFGKEELLPVVCHPEFSRDDAVEFVSEFTKNGKHGYARPTFCEPEYSKTLQRFLSFDKYPYYIRKAFMRPYMEFEEKVVKPFVYDPMPENDEKFLFFGFHLPTESTVGLRALPYVNQIATIESISRVLPYGVKLYVREHPHARKDFPVQGLFRAGQYPNVRVLSPAVPVSEVIQKSSGVLTFNSTTGIEALVYGKPVLSFAASIYSGFHPAALRCEDLYALGSDLARLMNTQVRIEDTYDYVQMGFKHSTGHHIASHWITSIEDAVEKSKTIADYLSQATQLASDDSNPGASVDLPTTANSPVQVVTSNGSAV